MSHPVHDEATTQARGVVEMALASVSIGTLGPVASLGYQAGLTPATFGALRAAIGAGILWAILASGRQPRVRLATLPQRQKVMLTGAALVNGLQNLFLFFAFGEMTLALVLLIFWLNPAMIAIASAALGRERLTPLRIGALALAGAGLVLILGSQAGPDANATPAGVVLAGLAAVCHAVYYLIVREGFPSVPAVQATTIVLLGGVLVSGSVAIVSSPTRWPRSRRHSRSALKVSRACSQRCWTRTTRTRRRSLPVSDRTAGTPTTSWARTSRGTDDRSPRPARPPRPRGERLLARGPGSPEGRAAS